MQTRALSLPLGWARSLHTFTHQLAGVAPTLVLKLFLSSPTLRKARWSNSGRRWARPNLPHSGLSPPRPAGPESWVEGRKLPRCRRPGSSHGPWTRPPPRAREAPRAPSGGVGPQAPEGGPTRAGRLPRAPEVCELTPPQRPAGRAPQPRQLARLGGRVRRASAAGRPESRNRCPAPLAEPPGPRG